MKYIKKFESLDRGFEDISVDEYFNDEEAKNIPFTDNEIEDISIYSNAFPHMIITDFFIEIYPNGIFESITINKLVDEWFFVHKTPKKGFIHSYYKCDQLFGLKNCLEFRY